MTKNMILIIAVLVILTINFASADVPPENSHPINRCIKFVNLNDFSDIVLIGFYTGPMIHSYEAYKIENDKCLKKGYKLNSFSIYWTTKEKFNSLNLTELKLDTETVYLPAEAGYDDEGNPGHYNISSPADLIFLLGDIMGYGDYVDENNPLINETIDYSIAGYSDGKLVVYISKKIAGYNIGPQTVENFKKPNINNKEPIFPTSTPEPTKNPETFEKPNVTHKEPIYSTLTPQRTQNPEPQPVKHSFWNSISCFFKKLFGGSC